MQLHLLLLLLLLLRLRLRQPLQLQLLLEKLRGWRERPQFVDTVRQAGRAQRPASECAALP